MSFVNKLTLEDGTTIRLAVDPPTIERLKPKAFRGFLVKCAGNFKRWGTIEDLLRDPVVVQQLTPHLADVIAENDTGPNSVTLRYPEPVGWSSTAPIETYAADALEPFNLNKRSTAQRVKLDRTDLLASQTDDLTVVFRLVPKRNPPVVVIYSVYPGPDVGKLTDDVSEREGVIFYDWNHPGA